jgi:hypothetical protein
MQQAVWLPQTQASDALLFMSRIDVETDVKIPNPPVKTIYQSHLDKNQYYYMPSNIRFAQAPPDPKNPNTTRPMFTVLKFNLAYNNGNWVDLTKKSEEERKQDNEVYQGGVLKATFTFGLYPGELKVMRDALAEYLKKANPGAEKSFKLGRFPLESASFSVYITDPENKDVKVQLGPFGAPVSEDIISVMAPLSRSATDILIPVIENKGFADAPINVDLTMRYSGFDVPYEVNVKGDWSEVYKATDTKAEVKASYWFFDSNASYQKTASEIATNSKIEINISGQPKAKKPDGSEYDPVEEIKQRVIDQIMKSVFDTNTIQPSEKDQLGADQGKAGDAKGTLFGKPVGVSVGFAMKEVDKRKTGSISFTQRGYQKIEQMDFRNAILDFGNIDPKQHLVEVNSSGWEVSTPGVEFALDLQPWFVSNSATIAWPGEKGPQIRTLPKPGKPITFGQIESYGVFGSPGKNATPVVPITYQCLFNTSPAALKEANINTEKKETMDSLNAASNIYKSIYGPTILIPLDNDYSRQPNALISKSAIAVQPEQTNVEYTIVTPVMDPDFDENLKKLRSLGIIFGDKGTVTIKDITLTQEVSAEIPVLEEVVADGKKQKLVKRDKSGNPVMQRKTASVATTKLPQVKPDSDYFSSQSGDLYLFPSSQSKTMISYTVEAGRSKTGLRVKKFPPTPYEPGSSITIDLGTIFPDLAPPPTE